jgi:hypothetical protein
MTNLVVWFKWQCSHKYLLWPSLWLVGVYAIWLCTLFKWILVNIFLISHWKKSKIVNNEDLLIWLIRLTQTNTKEWVQINFFFNESKKNFLKLWCLVYTSTWLNLQNSTDVWSLSISFHFSELLAADCTKLNLLLD